jgi:nicotinamidase-related amidase
MFPGHRPDLSTLSSREAFRWKNSVSGVGVGDSGPLGRFLIRGEEGHDTVPELYPVAGEPVIDKAGQGAFAYTDLDLLLRIRGVKNLIIAGVTTDVSIASTIREASDRGFDCLLVRDGTVASQAVLQIAACETVKTEGGAFGATAKLQDILNAVSMFSSAQQPNPAEPKKLTGPIGDRNLFMQAEFPTTMSTRSITEPTTPAFIESPRPPMEAFTQSDAVPPRQTTVMAAANSSVEACEPSSMQPSGHLSATSDGDSIRKPEGQPVVATVTSKEELPSGANESSSAQVPSGFTTQPTESSGGHAATAIRENPESLMKSTDATAPLTNSMPATHAVPETPAEGTLANASPDVPTVESAENSLENKSLIKNFDSVMPGSVINTEMPAKEATATMLLGGPIDTSSSTEPTDASRPAQPNDTSLPGEIYSTAPSQDPHTEEGTDATLQAEEAVSSATAKAVFTTASSEESTIPVIQQVGNSTAMFLPDRARTEVLRETTASTLPVEKVAAITSSANSLSSAPTEALSTTALGGEPTTQQVGESTAPFLTGGTGTEVPQEKPTSTLHADEATTTPSSAGGSSNALVDAVATTTPYHDLIVQKVEEPAAIDSAGKTSTGAPRERIASTLPAEEATATSSSTEVTPAVMLGSFDTTVRSTEVNPLVSFGFSSTAPSTAEAIPVVMPGSSAARPSSSEALPIMVPELSSATPSSSDATPVLMPGSSTTIPLATQSTMPSTGISAFTSPAAADTTPATMPANGTCCFMSPGATFTPTVATEDRESDVSATNTATDVAPSKPNNGTSAAQQPVERPIERPVMLSSAYPSTLASLSFTTCH